MPLTVTVVGNNENSVIAHPRDMVTIKEGTPYVVPTAKIFMLTGVGRTTVPTAAVKLVDFLVGGAVVLRAGIVGASTATVQSSTRLYPGVSSAAEVPIGITVAAGLTCTVSDNEATSVGRAYGYLSDA